MAKDKHSRSSRAAIDNHNGKRHSRLRNMCLVHFSTQASKRGERQGLGPRFSATAHMHTANAVLRLCGQRIHRNPIALARPGPKAPLPAPRMERRKEDAGRSPRRDAKTTRNNTPRQTRNKHRCAEGGKGGNGVTTRNAGERENNPPSEPARARRTKEQAPHAPHAHTHAHNPHRPPPLGKRPQPNNIDNTRAQALHTQGCGRNSDNWAETQPNRRPAPPTPNKATHENTTPTVRALCWHAVFASGTTAHMAIKNARNWASHDFIRIRATNHFGHGLPASRPPSTGGGGPTNRRRTGWRCCRPYAALHEERGRRVESAAGFSGEGGPGAESWVGGRAMGGAASASTFAPGLGGEDLILHDVIGPALLASVASRNCAWRASPQTAPSQTFRMNVEMRGQSRRQVMSICVAPSIKLRGSA